MKNQVKVAWTKTHVNSYGKNIEVAVGRFRLATLRGQVANIQPLVTSEVDISNVGEKVFFEHSDAKSYVGTRTEKGVLIDGGEEVEHVEQGIYKILVNPEQFTTKHLEAIMDGKIRNLDAVLVEIEHKTLDGNIANESIAEVYAVNEAIGDKAKDADKLYEEKLKELGGPSRVPVIKTDENGYVTLHHFKFGVSKDELYRRAMAKIGSMSNVDLEKLVHPVETNWDEIVAIYKLKFPNSPATHFHDWVKERYYSPIEKNDL